MIWRGHIFGVIFLLLGLNISAQTYTNVANQLNVSVGQSYPSAMSAGVSCVDFNDDGLDDITVASPYFDSLVFFENTGNGFRHISALVTHTSYSVHPIWVDYDNDGDKDLYVSSIDVECRLYRNDSSLGFTNVTQAAGLMAPVKHCYGATWGDFNRDGYLDLYQSIRSGFNRMYLNDGSGGFVDVSTTSNTCTYNRFAFSPVFADFDKDGLIDLFIGNDKLTVPELYLNEGDSTFTEHTVAANLNVSIDAMTASCGDYDNDGRLDIFVTNSLPYDNYLFRNNGDTTFTEMADSLGVDPIQQTWAASFFDYNNDGWKDLFLSEKHVGSNLSPSQSLYENTGNGFIQPNAGFMGDTLRSFSHSLGDFNNDGYYDIVSPNQYPDSLQLWQSSGGSNNYLKVLLEGTVSNRDAIGSWIIAYTDSLQQSYYTVCGDGFMSQSSNTKIIGLAADTIVDSLEIVWPNGLRETYYDLRAGSTQKFKEGGSLAAHLNFSGDTTFCAGDSFHISLEAGAYSQYLWNTGSADSVLNLTFPGFYYADVWNEFGIKLRTDTFEVKVDSLVLQTTVKHDSLNSAVGWAKVSVQSGLPPYSFQWDDPQQQSDSIAVNLAQGSYSVVVSDSLGCSDTAFVEIKNPLSLPESHLKIILKPNPAQESFALVVPGNIPLQYKIISLNGQVLQQGRAEQGNTISLQGIASGIYSVWLKADHLPAQTHKLVISR